MQNNYPPTFVLSTMNLQALYKGLQGHKKNSYSGTRQMLNFQYLHIIFLSEIRMR